MRGGSVFMCMCVCLFIASVVAGYGVALSHHCFHGLPLAFHRESFHGLPLALL